MNRFETLKTNKEFNNVYRNAKRIHTKSLIALYQIDNINKIGFTVSKKIGNAVRRNKAKRRIKALFREFTNMLKNGKYVFIAKVEINTIDYENLKKDLEYSFKRLRVL